MAVIDNDVFDNGLARAVLGDTIHITSQEALDRPSVLTNSLGSAPVTPDAISDGATDGRQVRIPPISNGTVTIGNPTSATHYSLISPSELVASQAVSTPQEVVSTNTFDLTEWFIRFRDPT